MPGRLKRFNLSISVLKNYVGQLRKIKNIGTVKQKNKTERDTRNMRRAILELQNKNK